VTGSLWHLAASLAVFVAAHVIPSLPGLRRALVALLTEKGYLLAYSALSIALLVWVDLAYNSAPFVEVWPYREWMRWVPLAVMPVACLLAVTGLTTPNPFSVGPGAKGYDPDRPGILRLTRHPALWAFILWAGAHIPPNGDAAGVMLFGFLFVLSISGPWVVEAKRRKVLGGDWEGLARNADRMLAVNPLLRGPHRLMARAADRLEMSDRAIRAYRALIHMGPVDPAETHYRLARSLAERGDRTAARRQVLIALDHAPRFRDAHRLLLELAASPEPALQEDSQAEAER